MLRCDALFCTMYHLFCEGQGPSEKLQKEGYYKMKFYGRGMDKNGNEQIVKGGLNAMKVSFIYPLVFCFFFLKCSCSVCCLVGISCDQECIAFVFKNFIIFLYFCNQGDPGYAQTARYIAEAGIACLPQEKGGVSGSGFIGGVLTPSTAFGSAFREHLKKKEDIKLDFYID